jgi:hypothetical protein
MKRVIKVKWEMDPQCKGGDSERMIKLHLNGERDQEPAPLTEKSQWDAPLKFPGKGHRHGCSTPARGGRLQGPDIGFQNRFETLIESEVQGSAENQQKRMKMISYFIHDKAKREKKGKEGNKERKGSRKVQSILLDYIEKVQDILF